MKIKFLKSTSILFWIKAFLIIGILATSCSSDDGTQVIDDDPVDDMEEPIGEDPTDDEMEDPIDDEEPTDDEMEDPTDEEPTIEEPEVEELEPGTQRAFITDTSIADTGELRLDLDETLTTGTMSVLISKEATQDGFINLSGTSTTRENALIDIRIDDANGYEFTESGDSINATANFPTFLNNELIQVNITWDATNATESTGPLVLVSIDGQTVTDNAFASESLNLASVIDGVNTIQFRLGGNASLDESLVGMSIHSLKVYDLSTGDPVVVFEDDFESYIIGDSLDPNAATADDGPVEGAISVIDSPYRNNSFQVTVQGEGAIVTPITPDPDPDPGSEGDRTSPFGFSDLFAGDDFQVDNDGAGAHNWNATEYDQQPINNGFDIRDYIFVADNKLVLKCPNSEHNEADSASRRRAEYRDQSNINLDDAHSMDFVFDIQNYDNSSELIMAQLHNDNAGASRPYITVLSENGVIRLQRTNAPTGSSSLRSDETIPFRASNQYQITIESALGDRSIYAKIVNLGTLEQAEVTFDFVEEWGAFNGDFYWKFGAYMPDGGSTDTQMRMESIDITG